MFFKFRQNHLSFICLFIVIFSSLLFRITNIDLIEFKSDEAINILLAANPLFGNGFTSGGTVSSLGILNPPIFNYILFPVVLLSLDPRTITLFMALLNVLGIVGFFLLLKRYYGLATALIASLLLSFSPWAVLYSRKIWMQDLLLPFTILLLLSIHKIILEKKSNYWILYTAASLILIQLHQLSIVFISILSIFMLRQAKLNLKYITLGTLIGLLPFIPYIIFEIQNKCPDCFALLSSRDRLNSDYSMKAFIRPLQILGVGDFRYILGNDTLTFAQKFPLAYKAREFLYFEYLLLPLGLVIFTIKNNKLSFLAYTTLLTIISYFLLKIESFMHYYIILLPLLFLFLATSFSFFLKSKHIYLKAGSAILLSILLLTSIAFNKSFFDLLNLAGGTKGDYGATFISKNKDTKERLRKYKDDPRLAERTLASYVPLSYMYGYEPFGKMFYGKVSPGEIPTLENQLKKDPDDKIAQLKLLNLHTREQETVQTIYVLRVKSQQIPQYIPIYREVIQRYMARNFKKEYTSSRFTFFYPEHWTATEMDDGSIVLGTDAYEITIKDLGLNNMKINCVNLKEECDNNNISEIKNSIRPIQ